MVSYLEKCFRRYKRLNKKITQLKEGPNTPSIRAGDVICIYGDTGPVYGVVTEEGVVKNCILLSPELFLAGDGLLLRVEHLVNLLRVTPINFYLTPNMYKACEPIGKLKQEDLARVVENFQNLRQKHWSGVRRKFFEYEMKRIEILYNAFLEFLRQVEWETQGSSN